MAPGSTSEGTGPARALWARVLVAGAVAGLVAGAWARVAMRVVAIVDPADEPEFTLGGTLAILLVFTIGGVLVGLPVAWVRRRLRLGGLARGLALGGAAFVTLLVIFGTLALGVSVLGGGPGTGAEDDASGPITANANENPVEEGEAPVWTALLFVAVFPLYGWAYEATAALQRG